MQITKKESQNIIKDVHIATECDLCKKSYKDITSAHPDINYDGVIDSYYDVIADEIEITRSVRASYYDSGGDSLNLNIDMCPKCWTEKFIPWYESQGGRVLKTVSEW